MPNAGFHDADFDTASFLSAMTFDNDADELVVARAGAYMVTAEVLWPQRGTGDRYLVVNSSAHGEVASQSAPATPSSIMGISAPGLVRLNAGERLSVDIAHTAGAPFPTDPSLGRGVALTASWVSP